ncbi:MAG: VWA domain-containing protein [bacterium]
MTDIFGIHWAGIDKIIYLPLFIFFIVTILQNYFRIKRGSAQLFHPTQKKTVFKHFSLAKILIKTLLLCSAIIFILLALLQPQWGKKEQTLIQEGRDLLILFDISRSMTAKDLKPNRLEFAKLKIRDLIAKLPVDRVGLIVFSGSAFVQCPLTIDHAAFLNYLKHIDVETIASGTTSIESALKSACDVFKQVQGRKNRLVLILTDGEDFSIDLDRAKTFASQQEIRLFALGIGTPEGAPIPIFDEHGNQVGHEKEDGKVALSKLNEQTLQNITKTLNGCYIRSTQQDDDIDQIVKIVKGFEKERFEDKTLSLFHDQYPWFLGISWALLALEWII